jgi:mannose-6-phosphate isomerase-like protein (cupin superfamily)
MNSYTIKNLKQVEDMAPKFGYAPDFEARFARQDLEMERTGISFQHLAPNTEGPFGHRHGRDEEVYVIVSGGGRVQLDGEVVDVGPWDAVRVAPATVRAFAAGPDGLDLLAFGTHTDDDASMQQVNWSG